MSRSQRNDNFIDKTFTIIAELIIKTTPTEKIAKKAFSYYRDGLASQAEGEYAEALRNYYEALRFEKDPFDRSYILYNIGLIHMANGQRNRALEYYFASLDRNPTLTQALNNVAILYHERREKAIRKGLPEIARLLFFRATEYWKEAIRLSPTNYIEAHNWIITTQYSGV
jgi:tetratricopeptide (TPR) repeat protein